MGERYMPYTRGVSTYRKLCPSLNIYATTHALSLNVKHYIYNTEMDTIYKRRDSLQSTLTTYQQERRLPTSLTLSVFTDTLWIASKIINQHVLECQQVCLTRLPSDHNFEADSVLGRGGNKSGSHTYNKQHEKTYDKVIMNDMNMHDIVLHTRPISNDKDMIANIIT